MIVKMVFEINSKINNFDILYDILLRWFKNLLLGSVEISRFMFRIFRFNHWFIYLLEKEKKDEKMKRSCFFSQSQSADYPAIKSKDSQ